MTFGTVAILGPGLIGGSLALALAERGLAEQLKVYSRRDTVFPAIKAKLPDAHLTTNIVEAVSDADVVVLCLPVETMAEAAGKILHGLKPGALVTDVGSVKESVDRELGKIFAGKALWIGSHPMAGSEKSGFTVARADLFAGATVILTPTKLTAAGAEDRAAQFWKAVGGRILKLDPKSHDVAVAQISHLPHLVGGGAALECFRDILAGRRPRLARYDPRGLRVARIVDGDYLGESRGHPCLSSSPCPGVAGN